MVIRNYSTKGIRLSSNERELIIIPDEIKNILVGILLGDAHIGIFVKISLLFFIYCFLTIFNLFVNQDIFLLDTNLLSYTLCSALFIYINPALEKSSILSENKGKSGIYMWVNKNNNKKYIGSSVDLSNRLRNYFNTSYLSDLKSNMLIYKALLAHGHSNFRLEILEYCEYSKLIEREQYYIDSLKPEYNLLKIAGSRLGAKHSEEAKIKIKLGALGRSEEALIKNREHLKKLNASKTHKEHLIKLNTSLEHIAISAKPVILINIYNGESIEYRSMTQAASYLKVHPETIRRCIKNNKIILNKYKIIQK